VTLRLLRSFDSDCDLRLAELLLLRLRYFLRLRLRVLLLLLLRLLGLLILDGERYSGEREELARLRVPRLIAPRLRGTGERPGIPPNSFAAALREVARA
jgi:hypothetical protein